MALQIWLPLNGNLENKGVSDLKFSNVSTSVISVSNEGKFGSCYKSTTNGSHEIVSDKTINLGNYVSMFCWVKPDNFYETANLTGVLGQHRYSNKTGLGITLRRETESSGYISITTGNGNGRTYVTYYGSTLLSAGTWYHVGFTYDNGAIKLYVNGNVDKTVTYANLNVDDYIQLFEWSFAGTAITPSMGVGYGLMGSLNDVRIYDHALSEKEVKELAKGLAVHYMFNDEAAEMTVNAATMATNGQSGWNALTYKKEPNDTYYLTHKAAYNAYWTSFHFDIGSAYIGKTVTVSATISDLETYMVSTASRLSCGQKKDSGQYPTFIENDAGVWKKTYAELKNGDEIRWTGTMYSAHTIIFELYDEGVNSGYTKMRLNNVQIEEKDHKTAYACGSRGQRYDNTIYTEPDGSLWVRIAHHNNPTNALFSSTENWSYGVYKDADRWLDVYPIMYRLSSYEFMVKQTLTSGATETKYRWIQSKSPLTAVYEDVAPAAVTRITTAGYTDGGYGGLYILNNNTYFVIANASKGNWYGAFGCWTMHQGGIPGYPNTVVKTGYMDLYVRISEADILKVYDSSGFRNDGTLYGAPIVTYDSPKYSVSIKYPDNNCSVGIGNLSTLFPENIYTFNIWFKKVTGEWSSKGWETIFGGPSGFEIQAKRQSTNSPVIVAYSWGQSSSGGQAYSLDTWNMLTMVQNSSNIRFFLNGSLFYTGTRKNNPSGNYFIGSWRDANTQNYRGYFSDARLYATALSDADILELYNVGSSIDNKGNIFIYNLKEN